jgi:hypothetical protein
MRAHVSLISALFLATGAAHAVEWQCGPHYVNSIIMHTEKPERYGVVIYPSYNRTRAQADTSGGGDEEFSILGPKSNHQHPPTVCSVGLR